MVVELDPVSDYAHRVLLGLGAATVGVLLLKSADYPLHHAVLLRAVRRDELVLQAAAAHQSRLMPAGEHRTIVRAQQERLRHAPQRAVAGDQRACSKAAAATVARPLRESCQPSN